MLYIAYYFLQNFPFFTCRGWKTACLCAHQMPLKHLQTAISKLLGGPWLSLDGPSGHYVGPDGHSSTRIVTK